MRNRILAVMLGGVLALSSAAMAAETPKHVTHESQVVEDSEPHPKISADGQWAGVMLLIVAGMFLAAAVIGPIVHANAPEEVPVAHAHDEPPGSSHHHGKSGTKNVDPDEHH